MSNLNGSTQFHNPAKDRGLLKACQCGVGILRGAPRKILQNDEEVGLVESETKSETIQSKCTSSPQQAAHLGFLVKDATEVRKLLEEDLQISSGSLANASKKHRCHLQTFNTTFSRWDIKSGSGYRAELFDDKRTKARIHWLHFYSNDPRETAAQVFYPGWDKTKGSRPEPPNLRDVLAKFLELDHQSPEPSSSNKSSSNNVSTSKNSSSNNSTSENSPSKSLLSNDSPSNNLPPNIITSKNSPSKNPPLQNPPLNITPSKNTPQHDLFPNNGTPTKSSNAFLKSPERGPTKKPTEAVNDYPDTALSNPWASSQSTVAFDGNLNPHTLPSTTKSSGKTSNFNHDTRFKRRGRQPTFENQLLRENQFQPASEPHKVVHPTPERENVGKSTEKPFDQQGAKTTDYLKNKANHVDSNGGGLGVEIDHEDEILFRNFQANYRAIMKLQGKEWAQTGVWDFRVWHQPDGKIPRYAKSLCIPFPTHTCFGAKKFNITRNAHTMVLLDQAQEAVSQLIAFSSKTVLITIAPVERDELIDNGKTISLSSHTRSQTASLAHHSPEQVQVIRVTTEHRQAYVFPVKYCRSWFAFKAMIYLNCFKDWETSQSAKVSFVFMNPSTGKEVYVDTRTRTTKVTAYNWIDLLTENMNQGYEIVLDLKLQIDEPYTDDMDITDEEDDTSQHIHHDQDNEVDLLLKLQAQNDSSKQNNHFDNRAICKPQIYQPLKLYKNMDSQKVTIKKLAVHLESPTSTSSGAANSTQDDRAHLHKQGYYDSASYTGKRYYNHGTSKIRESIDKTPNPQPGLRRDSAVTKDDISSQWPGDNISESGSSNTINDSERLEKLLARVLELAETRRIEEKKAATETNYLDTEVPEYGEAYDWKSPAFGRIHYPRHNAPDPTPPSNFSKHDTGNELPENPHWHRESESPSDSTELKLKPSNLSTLSIIEQLPIGFAEINRQIKAHNLKDRIISNGMSGDLDMGITELRGVINGPYLPNQAHHSTCTCFTCITDDIDMRMALTIDPGLAILFKVGTRAEPHANLLQHMILKKDYTTPDSDSRSFQAYWQEISPKLRMVRSTRSESSKYRIEGYRNALVRFYADFGDLEDPADSLHALHPDSYDCDDRTSYTDANQRCRYNFKRNTSFLFHCFFKPRHRHLSPTTLIFWSSVKRILDSTPKETLEDSQSLRSALDRVNKTLENLSKCFDYIYHSWYDHGFEFEDPDEGLKARTSDLDGESSSHPTTSNASRESTYSPVSNYTGDDQADPKSKAIPEESPRVKANQKGPRFCVLPTVLVDLFVVLTQYLVLIHVAVDSEISLETLNKIFKTTETNALSEYSLDRFLNGREPASKSSDGAHKPLFDTCAEPLKPDIVEYRPNGSEYLAQSKSGASNLADDAASGPNPSTSSGAYASKLETVLDSEVPPNAHDSSFDSHSPGPGKDESETERKEKLLTLEPFINKMEISIKFLIQQGTREFKKMTAYGYGHEYADHKDSPNAESILLRINQTLLDREYERQKRYVTQALKKISQMDSNGLNRREMYNIVYLMDHMAENRMVLQQQLQVLESCQKSGDWSGLKQKEFEHLLCNTATMRMNRTLLANAITTVTVQMRENEDITQRLSQQKQRIQQIIELRKETSETATLVFTIVTMVFLPLSFVTGYFGMNTKDMSETEATVHTFWAMAMILLVVFALITWPLAFRWRRIATRIWDWWANSTIGKRRTKSRIVKEFRRRREEKKNEEDDNDGRSRVESEESGKGSARGFLWRRNLKQKQQ